MLWGELTPQAPFTCVDCVHSRVQEEGNASAKVPEVDVFLEYSRNGKAASVTEAEQMREVLRK